VSGAVQLVPFAQVGPALAGFDYGIVGVQVAVWLLGPGNQGDYLVQQVFQVGVWMGDQGIAGSLDPLGHVRIPEDVRRIGHARFPVEFEGFDAAGVGHLFIHGGDGDLLVGNLPAAPKPAFDLDGGERGIVHREDFSFQVSGVRCQKNLFSMITYYN